MESKPQERLLAKGISSALTGLFFLSLIAVCVKLAGKRGAKLGWILPDTRQIERPDATIIFRSIFLQAGNRQLL